MTWHLCTIALSFTDLPQAPQTVAAVSVSREDLLSIEQERHRFAGALQTALTRSDVADACLTTATRVVPAAALGVYELDVDHKNVVGVSTNASRIMLDEYESYGRQDDPVLRFVVEHQRPIDSSRLNSPRTWTGSGARSALATSGLVHSMEAPLVVSGLLFGTINFARTVEQPAFSSVDLTSAKMISEQLSLATERALRYELTGTRASTLENALDRLPQAIVVTDLDAQPIFRNRPARTDSSLEHKQSDGNSETVGGCIDHAMSLFRRENKRVVTQTIRDDRTNRRTVVKSYRLSDKDRTAVTTIQHTDDTAGFHNLPDWGVLTRREQEIARLVSEGLTNREIAARAFISENTVKHHLKRVFAKADVGNRAELVQLIWTSGAAPNS